MVAVRSGCRAARAACRSRAACSGSDSRVFGPIGGPGTGLKMTARYIVFRSPCRSSKSCVSTPRWARLPAGGTSLRLGLARHPPALLDVGVVVLDDVDLGGKAALLDQARLRCFGRRGQPCRAVAATRSTNQSRNSLVVRCVTTRAFGLPVRLRASCPCHRRAAACPRARKAGIARSAAATATGSNRIGVSLSHSS